MGRERGGGLYIYRITANKINNTEYTTRLVYKISKFLGVMLYCTTAYRTLKTISSCTGLSRCVFFNLCLVIIVTF